MKVCLRNKTLPGNRDKHMEGFEATNRLIDGQWSINFFINEPKTLFNNREMQLINRVCNALAENDMKYIHAMN